MRLIYTLIIASVVGSAAVGGLGSFMTKGRQNSEHPAKAVARLYAQDNKGTFQLIEKASASCLPELSSVASNKLRKVLPRVIAYVIESRLDGKKSDKAQFRKHVVEEIIMPAAAGASIADLKKVDEIVNRQTIDKGALVLCIASTVVKLSDQKNASRTKTLLEGTELRGS